MPELAEVETVRRAIDEHLVGRTIREVEADPHDRFLYAFAKPAAITSALTGAKLKGTGRKGKYFWLEFNRPERLIIHLGMTGNMALIDPSVGRSRSAAWEGLQLYSAGTTSLWSRLKFCHFRLKFSSGRDLLLLDPRRFGRLWLSEDPATHPRVKQLGYDPLLEFPTAVALGKLLQRRKGPIKAALLDQKLFAGIGNWLADEILFQSRLDPRRPSHRLSPKEVARLRSKTLTVVRTAVAKRADYSRFPKSWLFGQRWGDVKHPRVKQGEIVRQTIAGRTTAWVPDWQT